MENLPTHFYSTYYGHKRQRKRTYSCQVRKLDASCKSIWTKGFK